MKILTSESVFAERSKLSIETQHAETSERPDASRVSSSATSSDRFVQEQLPLVRRICWRFRHAGVPLEDLFQVGSIGLVRAMKKYDPERGSAFAAFAVPVIVGEIKNYFRDHGWAVKVPRKLQMHTQAVHSAVDSLRQQRGVSPTIGEIAEATGLSEEVVYDTFEVGRYGTPVSLEAESDKDGSGAPSAPLGRLGSEDPELEGLADKIDLANGITCLDQRERTVIQLKFYDDLTQTEIAARLGVSQMHVSRLQRAALGKLRVLLANGNAPQ